MDKASRAILVGLFVVGFTIGTDFVGVGVLLGPIEENFDIDDSTGQWVMNIYALTFAMLMVTGGRICDIYGRKKMLIVGLVIFAVAAVLNATAIDIWWLLGSRALQGIGAALMWPAVLGLLAATVPAAKLGSYMGILLMCIGLGNILGPILGGVFAGIAPWGWRLFFGFNVVTSLTALGVVVFTARRAASDQKATDEQIDYAGIVVLSTALFGLLYAFDAAISDGWTSPVVIVLLVVFVAALVAFPFVERRAKDPLVRPELWHNKVFVAGVVLNGMVVVVAFVMFVYVPAYTQAIYGFTVAESGLALIPLMIFFAGLSPVAGRIYDRVGPRKVMLTGYLFTVTGSVLVAASASSWGYAASLIPGLALAGFGAGLTIGPAGTIALEAVEEKDASLAGGLGFTFHLSMGAIAIAIATLVLSMTVRNVVSEDLEESGVQITVEELADITGTVTGSGANVAVLDKLPEQDRAEVEAAVKDGRDKGFHVTFWVMSGISAIGLLLIPLLPRGKIRAKEPAPAS